MGTFFKLFKLQIDEKYDFFKGRNLKKLAWSLVKYVFLLFIIMLVLYLTVGQLKGLGFEINAQFVSIVLLITQIITFLFSLGNIISYLYYSKNNELLLSLPGSPNQVFFSKLLVVYVQEVVVSNVYCLPLLLVFGFIAKFVWTYYLFTFLFMFLLPLLPLSAAALLSVPATFLLRFLKKHTTISVVIILAFIAGAVFFYVRLLSMLTEFNLGSNQYETVLQLNKDIVAIGNKNQFYLKVVASMLMLKESFWAVVFLLISAVCLVVSILFIRPFYFRIAMTSGEEKRKQSKNRKYKVSSPFKSLLYKEVLTVFRSPGNVFQYFLFALLMPIIVILYDDLLMTLVVNQTGKIMINGAHVMIVAVLAMLSNIISASAISREGGNFYVMKTIPVSYYTQTAAKVVFNVIFTVGAVILTGIITAIYMTTKRGGNYFIPTYTIVCTTIAVSFAAIGHICQSFDTDLKKPALSWYDSGDIGKISDNTTKSIVWGLALAIIMGLIIMLLADAKYTALPWVLLVLSSVVFCFYKIYVLILRVSYQYENIET